MRSDAAGKTEQRYGFLDSFRGLLIVGMIAYHTLFDIALVYGWDMNAPLMKGANVVRDLGAACFIFLSGWCFHLGRNNIRKGMLLAGAGLAVTGVTYLFDRSSFVIFGILTLLGTAKLLLCALDRPLRHVPTAAGCSVSLALFLLFFMCNYGYAGYYDLILFRWPTVLYKNYLTAFFGFPFVGFTSLDYFSLLPWWFICLCGYFAYRAMQGRKALSRLLAVRVPGLALIGRYSLPVYLAHQPVIYGAVLLLHGATVR